MDYLSDNPLLSAASVRSSTAGAPHEPSDAVASPEQLVAGLNEPQRAAVEHAGAPLLIVAGAGSGKTRVLTHRIAHLLATGRARRGEILAITFTNKAAAEMRERIAELVGDSARTMWISTFHSLCVRILRREAKTLGLNTNFSIYDSADSLRLITQVAKQHELDPKRFAPKAIQHRISALKNELVDDETCLARASSTDPFESAVAQVYRGYTQRLRAANAMDFDDLIGETVHMFRAFPQVLEYYRRRFRHVLVDEYQDTNHAQYALVRELVGGNSPQGADPSGLPPAELTVVGDSDQSIYAFRGADIRNITDFERDFDGARVLMLEQNYRSTQNILSAANAVIGNNFDRREKRLWTDAGDGARIVGFTGYSGHDEAQFVADEIVELSSQGMPYSEMAVFYRTNAQTRALEEVLIRSAIPYRVIGGTKFYERAEIKDALAYLITVANPDDPLSLRRIMNVPRRGIGPATEAALQAFADEHGIPLRGAMRRVGELALGPKVAAAIADLAALLDEWSAKPEADPGEVLRDLLSRSGYTDALRRSPDPQDAARLENVEELVAVAREFRRQNPAGNLIDFLTDTALVAAADELDDSGGQVSLMTLHTAKGLEFDAVFITGIEEDLLPHRIAAQEPGGPAEERRLFYVGITRARQRLHLSLAMTRAQFGEVSPAVPSRFLEEIPVELVDWRTPPATMRPPAQRAVGRWRDEPRESFVRGFREPDALPASRTKQQFANTITEVRDNSALELAPGDRIRHKDFGDGTVQALSGEGPKRIAEVRFDAAGKKRLLVKIAPIEKL